ncbi:CrcB family protein [Nocardioidaceae bacterium]|nr:CrcB family protein [Nocardioidaceae bacterium]
MPDRAPEDPAQQDPASPVASTAALVAAGGALGALLRQAASEALPLTAVPWSTAAVNVAGSLLLGLLVGRLTVRPGPRWLKPTVGTGVLGGFTTFSTFAVDTSLRLPDHTATAGAYVALTVVGAVAAAGVGLAAGRLLGRRGPS